MRFNPMIRVFMILVLGVCIATSVMASDPEACFQIQGSLYDHYNGSAVCGVAGQTTFTYWTKIFVKWSNLQGEHVYSGGEGFPCGKTPYWEVTEGTEWLNPYRNWVGLDTGYFVSGSSGTKVVKFNNKSYGCPPPHSPILISLTEAQNTIQLTSLEDGTLFDMLSLGSPQQTPWTAPGALVAWVALDANNNGQIDNGGELFNTNSLKLLDSNGDGVVNEDDEQFASLRMWQDGGIRGYTEPGELWALPTVNICGLKVEHVNTNGRKDQYGTRYRESGQVKRCDGTMTRWTDVYVTVRL